MAGNTDNIAIWSEADTFIGALTATIPTANAAFALNATSGGTSGVVDKWDFVGILDGSAGFTESQTNDSTDYTGWGYGTIATSKKNLAITRTFTCLEENVTTLGLRYDAAGLVNTSGVLEGDLAGRDLNHKFRVAFETRTGHSTGSVLERYISKNYAEVDNIGDASRGEDNIATVPVTVKVFPVIVSGKPVYWHYYRGTVA